MSNVVLVRYDEIGVKGKNRPMFERQLVRNIEAVMESPEIDRKFGRIIIHTDKTPDLSKVYGISSYSTAILAGKTIEELQKVLKPRISFDSSKSFRVTCNRLDKEFPINSNEIAKIVGGFVQEQTKSKVDLKNFDEEIVIEVIDGQIYLVTETFEGPGGLPQGTEGVVLVLMDTEKSERAAELVARRGCDIVKIDSLQNIDEVAVKNKAKALVVADTLQNLKDYDTKLQVLRPLVGEA